MLELLTLSGEPNAKSGCIGGHAQLERLAGPYTQIACICLNGQSFSSYFPIGFANPNA